MAKCNVEQCLSIFAHISELLAKFTTAIPEALKPPVAKEPIKAIEILDSAFIVLFHELSPLKRLPALEQTKDMLSCIKTLDDLVYDFAIIHEQLRKLLSLSHAQYVPKNFGELMKEYTESLYSLVVEAKKKIDACTSPIHVKMLDDLAKEHGQPMAFAMNPYRPWDAPPRPLSKLEQLWRESLDPTTHKTVHCWMKSVKEKGE